MNNLILIKNHQAVTTSLIIAEKFKKNHRDVLRAIKDLGCSNDFTERNFALSEYKDTTGRKLPMYYITRDGFMFLAMGFTGKEADLWKEKLIQLFNSMEQALLRQSTPDWQQARTESKQARKDLCDVIRSFVEYSKGQGSKNADRYYVCITTMINKTLFTIEGKLPANLRDFLNPRQLRHLSTSEDIAINELESGMSKNLPYKDIFRTLKQEIAAFAEKVKISFVPVRATIQA